MSANSTPSAAQVPARKLTALGFFSITASMVITAYAYPNFASSGMNLVFFLLVAGVLWFLPVALVAAEMATVRGWESGGIFAWVGRTLGERWGFAALFYQWFQITVGFVAMSFFVLACFAYVVGWSALYNNPLVMFAGVAVIVWVLTLTQLGGTQLTEKIARIGFFGGVLTPAVILAIGIVAFFATGGSSYLNFDAPIVPDFAQTKTLVIFASFVLAFQGIEASASHVNELRNAERSYPLIMIALCGVAIVMDCFGGIAVASVLPESVLTGNMSYGVVSAFAAIFDAHFGMGWLVYVLALMLAMGVLAEISAWIVGPSRALLDAANAGILPPAFAKTNKHGVSVLTVIVQAFVVTGWDAIICGSLALSNGSSSSVAYLTAIGLTVAVYQAGYILMFLAYFDLQFKHADLPRTFHVPGPRPVRCIIAGAGLLVTIAGFVISFFPSDKLTDQANLVYVITLVVCVALSIAIPFVIYALRGRLSHSSQEPKAQRTGALKLSATGVDDDGNDA